MEKTIKRLRAIVEAGKASADDKKFIAELSIKYELPFEPKATNCKDCYVDQAVVIYNKIKDQAPSDCKARLRDDIDVMIDGTRINNATLTDELVEKYRGNGLPEHWFV